LTTCTALLVVVVGLTQDLEAVMKNAIYHAVDSRWCKRIGFVVDCLLIPCMHASPYMLCYSRAGEEAPDGQ
jgi:hypothetical protein